MTNPTPKNATMHLIEETLTAALKPMEGSVFKSVDSFSTQGLADRVYGAFVLMRDGVEYSIQIKRMEA